MLLEGKSCVITGAGSGVGRASALVFAREGARVVCADVMEEWAKETALQLQYGMRLAVLGVRINVPLCLYIRREKFFSPRLQLHAATSHPTRL